MAKYTTEELKQIIIPMILSAENDKQVGACADEIIKLVQQNERAEDGTTTR